MRSVVEKTGRSPVEVTCEDMSIDVPLVDSGMPSVTKAVGKPFAKIKSLLTNSSDKSRTYRKLHNITAEARHGEMILVLAPPASGCSSLLRVLAGYQDPSTSLSGSFKYNGADYLPGDYDTKPLKVSFMAEEDRHLPALTVERTFRVAAQLSTPMGLDNREKLVDHHVERMLELLGLDHVRDTIVGNSLLRGVSGGEKKRVSIGEALLLQGQFAVLDGWSRGLDSATALHIGRVLRALVNISGASCVSSLYQAGPELFGLFDKVLVLKDSRQLFFGDPQDAYQFMTAQGIRKPPAQTLPDFLTTVKGDPVNLSETWHASSEKSKLTASLQDKKAIRGNELPVIPTSLMHNMKWLFWREYHLTKANVRQYIAARLGRYIFQGLILGLLFLQLDNTQDGAYDRMGLLANAMNTMGTGTFALMPEILDQRAVFNRHKEARMFKGWTWPIAKGLWDIPLAFAEAVVFCSIVYWMTGLNNELSHYASAVLLFFLFNAAMSNIVRLVVYMAPDAHASQTAAGTVTVIFSFFSGFPIAQNLIPKWWKWAYYATPYSYMYRGLVVNEFDSLDLSCANGTPICFHGGRNYINAQLGIDEDDSTKWMQMIRLVGYCVGALALGAYGASKVKYLPAGNVLRRKEVPDVSLVASNNDEDVEEGIQETSHLVSPKDLSREAPPAEFTWSSVGYTVPMGKGNPDKALLTDIDGYCKPGTMVALMGPTGAGKTTLLDVLARRKTAGKMEGGVKINGAVVKNEVFKRVTAYVEQEDLHTPRATVREAVRFSATLRCKRREDAILIADQTVKLLGLDEIADVMIGSAVTGGGISLEALKRVTIAVELVSDPSVLFMDEPTSGLDTEGAMVVMESARQIANQGRTVICTIHQPSRELFSLFDSVLLLHEGRVAYFGEVGTEGSEILGYFENNNADMSRCSENPAETIMTFVKAGDIDWPEVWKTSKENTQLQQDLSAGPDLKQCITEEYENGKTTQTSVLQQLKPVFSRQVLTYERMPTYNINRMIFTIFVALLMGSTYWNLGDTVEDLHSYVSIIFVTANMGLIYAMSAVQPILEARPSFYRETSSGTYSPWVFAATMIVNEVPWVLLVASLWVNTLFWMTGLPSGAYWFYFVQYVNFSFFMQFYGLMMASLVPNLLLAQVLIPLSVMVWMLHSGFLILTHDIPVYLKEFNVVNPMTYFLRSSVSNILHYKEEFFAPNTTYASPLPCEEAPQLCSFVDGQCECAVAVTSDQFLDNLGWSYSTHFKDSMILLGSTTFCCAVFVMMLVRVRHIRR
eukprot:TRINITY_DN4349_c1_g3_i1.p1 TRINITY_DN4349_c1_g3~~TRINITY_DN4349_c1_g3_i1.p1  ORF type:complete len:1333 (+),score=319.36 TRINITY_DN4349_c1_g3_i1:173-4000(+)